jgi:hypothetical protein
METKSDAGYMAFRSETVQTDYNYEISLEPHLVDFWCAWIYRS